MRREARSDDEMLFKRKVVFESLIAAFSEIEVEL